MFHCVGQSRLECYMSLRREAGQGLKMTGQKGQGALKAEEGEVTPEASGRRNPWADHDWAMASSLRVLILNKQKSRHKPLMSAHS